MLAGIVSSLCIRFAVSMKKRGELLLFRRSAKRGALLERSERRTCVSRLAIQQMRQSEVECDPILQGLRCGARSLLELCKGRCGFTVLSGQHLFPPCFKLRLYVLL
jgi:hypothetical protein